MECGHIVVKYEGLLFNQNNVPSLIHSYVRSIIYHIREVIFGMKTQIEEIERVMYFVSFHFILNFKSLSH